MATCFGLFWHPLAFYNGKLSADGIVYTSQKEEAEKWLKTAMSATPKEIKTAKYFFKW